MSEHRFTDETATVVVLNQVIKDMRHLLDWLSVGLGCMAIINAAQAIDDATGGEWFDFGCHVALTLAFIAWSHGTSRRSKRYQPRGKR